MSPSRSASSWRRYSIWRRSETSCTAMTKCCGRPSASRTRATRSTTWTVPPLACSRRRSLEYCSIPPCSRRPAWRTLRPSSSGCGDVAERPRHQLLPRVAEQVGQRVVGAHAGPVEVEQRHPDGRAVEDDVEARLGRAGRGVGRSRGGATSQDTAIPPATPPSPSVEREGEHAEPPPVPAAPEVRGARPALEHRRVERGEHVARLAGEHVAEQPALDLPGQPPRAQERPARGRQEPEVAVEDQDGRVGELAGEHPGEGGRAELVREVSHGVPRAPAHTGHAA